MSELRDDSGLVDRYLEEAPVRAEMYAGFEGVGDYIRSQTEPLAKALERACVSGKLDRDTVKNIGRLASVLRDFHLEYAWRSQYDMVAFQGFWDALDIITAGDPEKNRAVKVAIDLRLDQFKQDHPRPVLKSLDG